MGLFDSLFSNTATSKISENRTTIKDYNYSASSNFRGYKEINYSGKGGKTTSANISTLIKQTTDYSNMPVRFRHCKDGNGYKTFEIYIDNKLVGFLNENKEQAELILNDKLEKVYIKQSDDKERLRIFGKFVEE